MSSSSELMPNKLPQAIHVLVALILCANAALTNQQQVTSSAEIANAPNNRRGDTCKIESEKLELRSSVDSRGYLGENIDDYPEEEINSILRRTPVIMKDLFNVRNTPLDPSSNLTDRISSFSRDDDLSEENVCRAIMRYVYPREARRLNSRVYVPNTSEFVQVIQVDVCESPNTPCTYLQDNLPYGFESLCVQKYSFKRLMYLDPRRSRMSSDVFRYPSCCSCYVRALALDRVRNPTARSLAGAHKEEINEITINGASLESITASRSSSTLNCPSRGSTQTADSSSRKPSKANKRPNVPTEEPSHPIFRQPQHPTRTPARSQTQRQPTSSPRSKATTQNTVVLQSDKVYIPDGEA